MAEDDLAAALALSRGSDSEVSQRAAALLALPRPSRDQSLPVLLKLLGNLANEPGNEKFRSVKLGNPKVHAAVVAVPEARALMLACGFHEQEGALVARAGAEERAREAVDLLEEATASYALARELAGHGGAVRCVCALPDGSVATGSADNAVRVFPAGGGAPGRLAGHVRTGGVDGVLALCPAGPGSLASGGRDGKIIVWDTARMAAASELAGHGEGSSVTNARSIGALAQLADGTLASGGWDQTVRLWNSGSPQVLPGHSVAVNGVCALPGGELASASGDGTVRVWRRDGAAVHVCEAGSPARGVCAVGDSGVAFASVHNDGRVRAWAADHSLLRSAVASGSYLFSVGYCPGREVLATGGDDGAAKLWSLALEQLQELRHPMEVYGVAFSACGDLLTACGDQTARVWTRDPKRVAPPAVRSDLEARVAAATVAAAAASGAAPAAGGRTSAGGPWDFEFPVELTGGGKMTLRWRRGERTEDVANRFLQEHGLGPNHAPDVLAFVAKTKTQVGDDGSAAGGEGQTYSYPVEVADGRRLTISWGRGEDPMAVARRFAAQNGIGAEELNDIASFISQVQGATPPAAPGPAAAPVAVSAEMVAAVTSMGFDEASARAALQAAGGSVEVAVARLLG